MLMQAPPGTLPGVQITPFSGNTYTVGTDLLVTVSSQQDSIALQSQGFFPIVGGRNNLTATVDPAVGNDNTQDYLQLSVWLNTATSPPRAWLCESSATGAAIWLQISTGGLIATAGSGALVNLVLSGLLTHSSNSGVTAFSGGGQASATVLTKEVNNITTASASSSPYDSTKFQALSAGQIIWLTNAAGNPVQHFANGSETINGFASATGVTLPVGFVGYAVANSATTWLIPALPSAATNVVYNTNAATSGTTLTGANISGANQKVVLNLTGTLGGGANAQLPTVANLVSAIPNAAAGQSYELRVINSSSANFDWAITTNTGWTLSGTMTAIAQNTWRDFLVTLTTTSAAVLRTVGNGTFS